jgi:hypothetical protein
VPAALFCIDDSGSADDSVTVNVTTFPSSYHLVAIVVGDGVALVSQMPVAEPPRDSEAASQIWGR